MFVTLSLSKGALEVSPCFDKLSMTHRCGLNMFVTLSLSKGVC